MEVQSLVMLHRSETLLISKNNEIKDYDIRHTKLKFSAHVTPELVLQELCFVCVNKKGNLNTEEFTPFDGIS